MIVYAVQNVFLFDSFSAFLMFIVALAYLNSFSQEQNAAPAPRANVSVLAVPLVGVSVAKLFFHRTTCGGSIILSHRRKAADMTFIKRWHITERRSRTIHMATTKGAAAWRCRRGKACARYRGKELPEGVDAYSDGVVATRLNKVLIAPINTSHRIGFSFCLRTT